MHEKIHPQNPGCLCLLLIINPWVILAFSTIKTISTLKHRLAKSQLCNGIYISKSTITKINYFSLISFTYPLQLQWKIILKSKIISFHIDFAKSLWNVLDKTVVKRVFFLSMNIIYVNSIILNDSDVKVKEAYLTFQVQVLSVIIILEKKLHWIYTYCLQTQCILKRIKIWSSW